MAIVVPDELEARGNRFPSYLGSGSYERGAATIEAKPKLALWLTNPTDLLMTAWNGALLKPLALSTSLAQNGRQVDGAVLVARMDRGRACPIATPPPKHCSFCSVLRIP